MAEDKIDECFHLMGMKRGATFASVKHTYRNLLKKCHPDRFQKKPHLIAQAERKTKHLIEIYSVLEDWYERHGGIDPVPILDEEERREPEFSPPFSEPASNGSAYQETPSPRSSSRGSSRPSREPNYDLRPQRKGLAKNGKLWASLATVVVSLLVWSAISQRQESEASSSEKQQTTVNVASLKQALANKQSELDRIIKELALAKEGWGKTYIVAQRSKMAAAEKELADAKAQYTSDVDQVASKIIEAENVRNELNERAERERASARADALRKIRESVNEPAHEYSSFVRVKGQEAMALINSVAQRNQSKASAFVDTENPSKIFEYWSPEEANAPENRIAAKAGIVVGQNGYVFPHFRTNIYFYDAESKQLLQMMEDVIAQNDAAFQQQQQREAQSPAEIAAWDQNHPATPADLNGDLKVVLSRKEAAIARLNAAESNLETAKNSLNTANMDSAFAQSDDGRQWAQKISAAHADVGTAQLALDQTIQPVESAAVQSTSTASNAEAAIPTPVTNESDMDYKSGFDLGREIGETASGKGEGRMDADAVNEASRKIVNALPNYGPQNRDAWIRGCSDGYYRGYDEAARSR